MPILGSLGGLSAIGRGARAGGRKTVQIVIAANTNNYILKTANVAVYEAGNTDVELVINTGVVVGATSNGSFAFDIDTSWNVADSIKIINRGTIAGCGMAGAVGGPALRAQRPVFIDNSGGVIAGAGGSGGHGGPAYSVGYNSLDSETPCGAAWGGCGTRVFAGGLGGRGQGSQGAATNGSTGASDVVCCYAYGGTGGYGGVYGSAGSPGAASSSTCCGPVAGVGGFSAGSCTSGNAKITWLSIGTRHGALN